MSINKPWIPSFDSVEWFYKTPHLLLFQSDEKAGHRRCLGSHGATPHFIPCPKSLNRPASTLVFIYQKIETKTIWSPTDPNLIPSLQCEYKSHRYSLVPLVIEQLVRFFFLMRTICSSDIKIGLGTVLIVILIYFLNKQRYLSISWRNGYEEVNLKICRFVLYSFIQTSWVCVYAPSTTSSHVS